MIGSGLELLGFLDVAAAVLASGHVVLRQRDSRVAAGWVAVVWLAPLVGPLLYLLLGINRIQRRAAELRRGGLRSWSARGEWWPIDSAPEGGPPGPLRSLERLVGRITGVPLLGGNAVDPLRDGDEAYPAMIEAIDAARHSVALCTYIFDRDAAGRMFADALERARERGVELRVLLDGVGARYSCPPMHGELRRRGIPVARFLHSAVPWRMPYMNLRTHRKILVVDGRTGFTGGMNLRAGHLLALRRRSSVQDVHFRVRGPVVRQMTQVFAADWAFTTGEVLEGDTWFPTVEAQGRLRARGIADGPDEDLGNLPWTLQGALAAAQRSIRIVTPYFLPDEALLSALAVAAMRGVRVDIVLPEKNNLPLVNWAMREPARRALRSGCRVHLSAPPFDHSKLMTVDGSWSLIGSANWDPRSLRLNFEYNLECHGEDLAARIDAIVDEKIAAARPLLPTTLEGRGLPTRLRDGLASLLTPYL